MVASELQRESHTLKFVAGVTLRKTVANCRQKYMNLVLSQRLPFNRVSIDRINLLCSGVYIFWFTNMCLYVGKTDRSLKDRLREHWGLCHNDELKKWIKAYGPRLDFQWQCVDDVKSTRAVEQLYINKLGPLANKIDAEKKQ